jgi:hypothetical protein
MIFDLLKKFFCFDAAGQRSEKSSFPLLFNLFYAPCDRRVNPKKDNGVRLES